MAEEEEKVIPSFEEMMKDETFQKTFQSKLDSAVSKGVDTYKNGSFKNAVDEAAKKLADERLEAAKHKTPEQLQIEEMASNMKKLQSELAEERKIKQRATNKSLALKGLTDKGLPSGFIDFIVDDTEETTLNNLENISKVFNDYLQGIKTDNLKNNNTKVPEGHDVGSGELKEPGPDATKAEWTTYFKSIKK